jgi:hypothetical protein
MSLTIPLSCSTLLCKADHSLPIKIIKGVAMDNIIYLEQIKSVTNNTPANRYLEICRDTLDEADYDDLITAINDPEFYTLCDEEIQDLVDGYYDNLHRQH